ncbi:MAG: hypothetical protein PGN07_04630 [Aeromicrobium erythreum]
MSDFGGRSLHVGTLRGLRAFNVDELGRLRGVSHAAIWKPGENLAQHMRASPGSWMTLTSSGFALTAPRPEAEPGEDHDFAACRQCGFYAYFQGADERYSGTVQGVVEGYGVVHVGSQGFRSEKAKIVALLADNPKRVMSKARWRFDALARHWAAKRSEGSWATPFGLLGIVGGVVGAIACVTSYGPLVSVPAAVALACVSLLGIYLLQQGFRSIDYQYPLANNVESPFKVEDSVQLLKRNYPGIPIYASLAEMLRDFPVSEKQIPTPETDPDFWTRSI